MMSIPTGVDLETVGFIKSVESNARTYANTFDRALSRGELAKIWDVDGNQYLDCLSCAGALPLGHNHPYVVERVTRFLQTGHILQGLDIPTFVKKEFLEQLLQILPRPFAENARIQFCGPTGSDAVEAAIKLFKTATGRRSIIAFHGAYHGMTLGALSLTGNLRPKQAISGLMPEVHFFPYPHSSRCPFGMGGNTSDEISLYYLDHVLSDPESGITKPAMLIVEAIQGEGGCIPASAAWLRGLREITRFHDIPLVIDEVQTGFGRTGDMFAHEFAGIEPDAIVMSKALGGGFPLAALAYHRRYDNWMPGAHAGTFRGNKIAFVAGAATMEFIISHTLQSEVIAKGEYLMDNLRQLSGKYSCIGEVRGRGLMVGMEITVPESIHASKPPALNGALAGMIKREAFSLGLILETGGRHGAVLRFLPPLIITAREIDHIVKIIDAAICRALIKRQADRIDNNEPALG